jgi:hypothetical protein
LLQTVALPFQGSDLAPQGSTSAQEILLQLTQATIGLRPGSR